MCAKADLVLCLEVAGGFVHRESHGFVVAGRHHERAISTLTQRLHLGSLAGRNAKPKARSIERGPVGGGRLEQHEKRIFEITTRRGRVGLDGDRGRPRRRRQNEHTLRAQRRCLELDFDACAAGRRIDGWRRDTERVATLPRFLEREDSNSGRGGGQSKTRHPESEPIDREHLHGRGRGSVGHQR